MRILAAMTSMEQVLKDVEAPQRQLLGVRAWRAAVADAVAAGRPFTNFAGMHLVERRHLLRGGAWSWAPQVRFLHGDPTHQAWAKLCKAIIDALRQQQAHASDIAEAAREICDAAVAKNASAAAKARGPAAAARVMAAEEWWCAAAFAVASGRDLLRTENKISRPVGRAIAYAGGVDEVAQDRNYHQAGRF